MRRLLVRTERGVLIQEFEARAILLGSGVDIFVEMHNLVIGSAVGRPWRKA
jgi:hypothetical protein